MARNLRNHVVIIATVESYNEGSVGGSGPSYTVTYDSGQDISAVQGWSICICRKKNGWSRH